MRGILLDASVVANWLIDEAIVDSASQALHHMQKGVPVSVPTLWLWEITNVVMHAERRKRIPRSHREAALARIENLPVTILPAPSLTDLKGLQRLAEKHQLTAYDAEYLRLAKEMHFVLASLDRNLIAAAKREKVSVLS